MNFEIKALSSASEFSICASLMMRSHPWDQLYFSTQQCEADLANPSIAVHGAAAEDGTVLGFLASMAHGIGMEPMVEYLCVDEPMRGQGIGTALIEYFEKTLFPDAANVYLFVSDINPAAMRLYEKLGYSQVGALPNFNLEMQTEFLFRKSRRPRQAAFVPAP